MSKISANGITISLAVAGAVLSFVVLEQTAAATAAIKSHPGGTVVDAQTGIGVRSNKRPGKNFTEETNFYLRGSVVNDNEKVITVKFASSEKATAAADALKRIIKGLRAYVAPVAVRPVVAAAPAQNAGVKKIHPTTVAGSKKAYKAMVNFFKTAYEEGYLVEAWRLATGIRSNDAAYGSSGKTGKDGKTGKTGKTGKSGKDGKNGKGKDGKSAVVTLVRHALLTKPMAKVLRVTNNDNYPDVRYWNIMNGEPDLGNKHANEHFGLEQGSAGVLNAAFSE